MILMLSCQDITEKASDYLDRDLPFTTRLSVRVHLFMCVNCRRYVQQLQTTIKTLRILKPEHPATPDLTQNLVKQFKHHHAAKNDEHEP